MMTRSIRTMFAAAFVLAVFSCGSDDTALETSRGLEPPDGSVVATAAPNGLPSIPLPPPGPPAGAELVPIPEAGGIFALTEGIRVIVPAGAVEGELELASWRPPAAVGLLEPWRGRLRQLSDPFAFSIVGRGRLKQGRLEADVDDATVGDGWEVRLLQYSPELLAQAGAAGRDRESPQLPWSLSCAGRDIGENLTAALLELMPASRHERYFQLVAVRRGTTHELDTLADLGVQACLHVIDPPVHDESAYLSRVEAALRTSVEAARAMGFSIPAARDGPLSLTVIGGLISHGRPGRDREYSGAATVGGMIVLRNDLHTWLPRTQPGLLERAVAHELFHVIQTRSMTEATLNATSPGNGNLWAVEGGATWFAREVFPEASRGLSRPDGASLRAHPYQAWAFWAFLEEKVGEGVMRDVLTMSRGHALATAGLSAVENGGRDGSVVSAYEWLDLAEALNAVLGQRDAGSLLGGVWSRSGENDPALLQSLEPLSIAYGYYARSLLFDGDFDVDDSGDALSPGLWYGHSAGSARPSALRELDLIGTDRFDPLELRDPGVEQELSAYVFAPSPLDYLGYNYGLRDFAFPEGAHLLFARSSTFFSPPRLNFETPEQWYRATTGSTPGQDAAPVVLINPNWTRWRAASEDPAGSRVIATNQTGPLRFTVAASLMSGVWSIPERPVGPQTTVQASGKTYCVSKQGDEDCQGAINQALQNPELEPGDTIEVRPGLYTETLNITTPVNLVATQPGKVVVRAPGTVVAIAAADVGMANFVIVSDAGFSTDFAVQISEAQNTYFANNVVVREGGGGIAAIRSPGATIADNWVATPRWGIRVVDSAGAIVVSNVVSPADVRSDIDDFRFSEYTNGIEWPGDEPWGLTEPAIEIRQGSGIVVTDNFVGPGTSSRDGYESAISVSFVSGLELARNVAYAYNEGIGLREVSASTVADNRAAGLRGMRISAGDTLTVTRNRGDGRWIGLDVSESDNVRLVDNEWTGGGPNEFAVRIEESYETSVLSDSVWGRADGRGGMWVQGGVGLAVTDTRVSGWSVGLQIDGTTGVNLSTSTFEQRRPDDHPAWGSAALQLANVRGPGARSLALKGSARALLIEDVSLFNPEELKIELAPGGLEVISARDAEMRATDAWIHSEADRLFLAENARLSFESLSLGVPELPPLAAFTRLEFVDREGGPVLEGSSSVPQETSILSQERDLSLVPSSGEDTLWLPFVWYVENGQLELNAALDLERTPRAVSGDLGTLRWRQASLISAQGADNDPGSGTDLEVSYSGVVPLRLRLVLPRSEEPVDRRAATEREHHGIRPSASVTALANVPLAN